MWWKGGRVIPRERLSISQARRGLNELEKDKVICVCKYERSARKEGKEREIDKHEGG